MAVCFVQPLDDQGQELVLMYITRCAGNLLRLLNPLRLYSERAKKWLGSLDCYLLLNLIDGRTRFQEELCDSHRFTLSWDLSIFPKSLYNTISPSPLLRKLLSLGPLRELD